MVTLQIIVPKLVDGEMRYEVESLTLPIPVERDTLLEWLEIRQQGSA
jgi:hypothetical protein